MTKAERDAVIDACIQRVLSLRDPLGGESEEEVEAIFSVTGAACFRLLQLQSEPIPEPRCRWTEDEDGNWHTACEHVFGFISGGPVENHMQFCGYCGQPLTEQRIEAEA